MINSYIGYTTFLIILFIVTGLYMVFVDVARYRNAALKKEKTWSLVLGWVNMVLGGLILLVNWVYQQWILFGWQ